METNFYPNIDKTFVEKKNYTEKKIVLFHTEKVENYTNGCDYIIYI